MAVGFDQRGRKGGREFRMELERDCTAVVQPGIRSELTGCDHPSIGGQRDDLILVRCGDCYGPTIIYPIRPRVQLVAMETYSPPLRRFDDGAAECLSHCLMTEANADQFRIAAAGISKKSHEVVDPRLAIINSGGGSR